MIIDEIKAIFSLEDAIAAFVPVEGLRVGHHKMTGKCPFHKEKTPSWSGRIKDNRWYCFGCHLHGDQIDLVARYLKLDTGEAINLLANHLGISRYVTPEEKMMARQAIEARRQAKLRKEAETSIIHEQYARLCSLERMIFRVLNTVNKEEDLKRTEVVAAVALKDRIGFYLDSFLCNSEQDNLELAQILMKRDIDIYQCEVREAMLYDN
jgi:DNA primase